MAVSADLNKLLDKAYEGKDLTDLVDAPVSALSGVSESDGELLATWAGTSTSGPPRPCSTSPTPRSSRRTFSGRAVTTTARPLTTVREKGLPRKAMGRSFRAMKESLHA